MLESLNIDRIGKTVNQKVTYICPKDTIDDDEIKEEINIVDDSDDDDKNKSLRKRFMNKMHNIKTEGRQSKTSNNQRREIK